VGLIEFTYHRSWITCRRSGVKAIAKKLRRAPKLVTPFYPAKGLPDADARKLENAIQLGCLGDFTPFLAKTSRLKP